MARVIVEERRNKIAQMIVANGSIKVGEIAQMFEVSTETIRKDLIYLNKKGIVKKSHGGALSTYDFSERPLHHRETENLSVKNEIAVKALELIPKKAVIYLDAGSTVLCLAKLLSLKSGYTIITGSLSAAGILANSKNVLHISGGEVSGVTMAMFGYGATSFLSKIKVDISFLGTSGFQEHNGPASIDFQDAEVKRCMIANSKKVVVLADSGKSAITALVEYTSWKNVDYFISDSGLSADARQKIAQHTEVLLV